MATRSGPHLILVPHRAGRQADYRAARRPAQEAVYPDAQGSRSLAWTVDARPKLAHVERRLLSAPASAAPTSMPSCAPRFARLPSQAPICGQGRPRSLSTTTHRRLMSVKITLWMALSLNAMAAREDHSEDFLSSTDWDLFVELLHAHDSLVWGRVTHELFIDQVRRLLPDLPVAVVTRNPELAVDGDIARAASPQEALAELSAHGAATALLAGGPHLNAAFVREQLVDEVVLALEPVIVARGLPLLIGDAPDLRLDLLAVDDRGPTLRVHYRVASGSVG